MSEPDDILRLLRHIEPADGDAAATGDSAHRDDAMALADLIAGRIVACDSVAAWLGGWHHARTGAPPQPALSASAVADIAPPRLRPAGGHALVWTRAALIDCDRLRRLLIFCGGDGDRRLAAAIVTTMVRVIVDGADDTGTSRDIATLPILPPLMLRLRIERARLVALGLRWQGTIT